MPGCSECRRYFGHADWCGQPVKAVILDRGKSIESNVPRYTVPIEDLRESLSTAWYPSQANSNKRPSYFKDKDREYHPRHREESLWEYPYSSGMEKFCYDKQNNTSGKRSPDHELYKERLDPGYGRIMASDRKVFRGFSRHPIDDCEKLDRWPEIRQSRFPGYEKLVTYDKTSGGKPIVRGRYPSETVERRPDDYF